MIDRSKLPNAFEFITVAGARARQLLDGCTPRVATTETKKTRIAQREVIEGFVAAVPPPEAPAKR